MKTGGPQLRYQVVTSNLYVHYAAATAVGTLFKAGSRAELPRPLTHWPADRV
jgi:hypothetical protein